MAAWWQKKKKIAKIMPPNKALYSEEEIKPGNAKGRVWIRPYCLNHKAPAVIVCPGGAYQRVSMSNEGEPIALELNRQGFHAFILNYRVGRDARYPAPMEDLARAICWIKAQTQFEVDETRVTLWGASAAGHLCAYFGARYDAFDNIYEGSSYSLRPHSIVLSYPVVSMLQETHACSRNTLLGRGASREERRDKSADLLVTPSYPPTFLWHCEDDTCVPVSNSVRLAAALKENGVPYRYCQYPRGGHGIGLGKGTSAESWFCEAINFISMLP